MQLERQFKIALDESRLLILGAQVLFGFQFNSVFQEQFKELAFTSRILVCAGLVLIVVAVALLIAPSMQHRIAEKGQDSPRLLALVTLFAGMALLPISAALAIDIFVAMERIASAKSAILFAAMFFGLAMVCWYALEWIIKRKKPPMPSKEFPNPTSLETQVDQLLTEARVIIPGAQALLGFQLTVTLTRAFQDLPSEAKVSHAAALCCIALAVIFLMAPASLHRISFSGQDHPDFLKIGSFFVVAAPLPLALGIALDTYVAAERALQSEGAAFILAFIEILVLLGVWYVYPLWRRMVANP
jgi:uncharacterized protein DUF6328